MTGFALTNKGTPTTTSGAILQSTPFSPGIGGLVYVVVWDAGGVSPPQTAPTDGTNSYNVAQSGGFPAIFNTYYFYYASSPGTITISYTPVNAVSPDAGMSVALITGSNGTYDSSGSAQSGPTTSNTPSVSSNAAALVGELALATIGTTDTTETFTQASGWTNPPNSIGKVSTDINVISGGQTISGTGSVTYNPSVTGILNWVGIIDLFEPATVPAGLLLPPANIVVM